METTATQHLVLVEQLKAEAGPRPGR
jgi:hypothetical protein